MRDKLGDRLVNQFAAHSGSPYDDTSSLLIHVVSWISVTWFHHYSAPIASIVYIYYYSLCSIIYLGLSLVDIFLGTELS